jgi:hypothetical protein
LIERVMWSFRIMLSPFELPWYLPGWGGLVGATRVGKTVAALGRARRLPRALSDLQVAAVHGFLRSR